MPCTHKRIKPSRMQALHSLWFDSMPSILATGLSVASHQPSSRDSGGPGKRHRLALSASTIGTFVRSVANRSMYVVRLSRLISASLCCPPCDPASIVCGELAPMKTDLVHAYQPSNALRQTNYAPPKCLTNRVAVCGSSGFNTEPRDSPNEPQACPPDGFRSASNRGSPIEPSI